MLGVMVLVMVRGAEGEEVVFIARATCDAKVEELTAELIEVCVPSAQLWPAPSRRRQSRQRGRLLHALSTASRAVWG